MDDSVLRFLESPTFKAWMEWQTRQSRLDAPNDAARPDAGKVEQDPRSAPKK